MRAIQPWDNMSVAEAQVPTLDLDHALSRFHVPMSHSHQLDSLFNASRSAPRHSMRDTLHTRSIQYLVVIGNCWRELGLKNSSRSLHRYRRQHRSSDHHRVFHRADSARFIQQVTLSSEVHRRVSTATHNTPSSTKSKRPCKSSPVPKPFPRKAARKGGNMGLGISICRKGQTLGSHKAKMQGRSATVHLSPVSGSRLKRLGLLCPAHVSASDSCL